MLSTAAASGVLQIIPHAKNDPLRQLMRGPQFEFALLQKPQQTCTSARPVRYIYDSERNVTQNIRVRSEFYGFRDAEEIGTS